jgi:hypothetical protein
MAQLNEARYEALLSQVTPGQTNDMLVLWLQLNGATSPQLSDAWYEMLIAQGFTGQRDDMWHELLVGKGYTGTTADMELEFWFTGGII